MRFFSFFSVIFSFYVAPIWGAPAPVPGPCDPLFQPAPSLQKESASDPERFLEEAIKPVIKEAGKTDQVQLKILESGTIELITPNGQYHFSLRGNGGDHSVVPQGHPEVQFDIGTQKLSAHLEVPASILDHPIRAKGLVRSSLRADPLFRPNLSRDKIKAVLNEPQEAAVRALLGMNSRKVGLVMTTGLGKTVTSAHYIAARTRIQMANGTWKRAPKILFVVENQFIIDQALATYQRELDILEEETQKICGKNSQAALDRSAKIIAITRSSYANPERLKDIHEFLRSDPDQPWILVFDEAHHVGKTSGQFAEIFSDLDTFMSDQHHALFLSATLWHEDQSLVTDILHGNVYGALLTDAENQDLRAGNRLEDLCLTQYFRSMEYGYNAPMHGVTIVQHIGEIPIETLLDDYKTTDAGRQITVHVPLLQDVVARIEANRRSFPDRGVLFVPSIEHAEQYTRILRLELGESADVRCLHGESRDRVEILSWIKDEENAPQDGSHRHKYLIVVDMLNEGVDIPGLNLVVFLKNFGETQGGFRSFIQNLGRGSRVSANKTDLRVIDYSGFSCVFAEELLNLTINTNLGGGEKRPPSSPVLLVDRETVLRENFRESFFRIFSERIGFEQKFPEFNLGIFLDEENGSLWTLAEIAQRLGVGFTTENGAENTLKRLAEELIVDGDKRSLVIEKLTKLGLKKRDGSEANNGQGLAAQRIYQGLYTIAKELKDESGIEPKEIYKREVFQKFIGPLELPKLANRDLGVFRDDVTGSLGALAEIAQRLGMAFSKESGAENILKRLAEELIVDGEKRSLVLEKFAKLGLNKNDGGSAKSGQGPAAQRIYQGLYVIAEGLKDESGIEPKEIYKREVFQRLMGSLDLPRLDEASLAVFRDEGRGSFEALVQIAQIQRFGLTKDNGAENTLNRLANKLITDVEKRRSVSEKLATVGFKKDDGRSANQGTIQPAQRIYQGLYIIAKELNVVSGVEPQEIYKREVFLRFIEKCKVTLTLAVSNAELPELDEESLGIFREKKRGSLNALAEIALELGVGFSQGNGAENTLKRLAKKLITDEEKCRSVSEKLENLGLKKKSGGSSKSGNNFAAQRIYQGLYLIAEELKGESGVEPQEIYKREALEKLLIKLEDTPK